MAELSGIVIVTGAASGLGRESARHFADCGAEVLAVDIDRAGLDEIASPRIEPFVADVSRAADCAAAAARAAAKGPVTGLLAGQYYAIAVDAIEPGDASDPEFLDRVRSRATRFSLNDGEIKTMDLRVVSGS